MVFDHLKVFDHAHVVFGTVAFVELFDAPAGKFFAFTTKSGCQIFPDFTGYHDALAAVGRFVFIQSKAAAAGIFRSQIGHACPAVHAAGCDQALIAQPGLVHEDWILIHAKNKQKTMMMQHPAVFVPGLQPGCFLRKSTPFFDVTGLQPVFPIPGIDLPTIINTEVIMS